MAFYFGMLLGLAFLAFIAWSIFTLSFGTLVLVILALIFVGFVRLQFNFERTVYKWTNGRPRGED